MRTREENLEMLRQSVREITPGQKFEVLDFAPEHAPGIAALFHAVYGDKFPVDSVYDPDQIIEANAHGQVRHIVGRTTSGDIVGLHALFRNPPGGNIMEAGSWIVLPSYRNTSLAVRMAQRTLTVKAIQLGLHVIHTQNVCDHVISQKVSDKFKLRTFALELEAMPARPDDEQGDSAGRITLADAFQVLQDSPHGLRIPDVYADALGRLYAAHGLHREFLADGPPQGDTLESAQIMEVASLARLTVESIGRDIADRLVRFEADHSGRLIRQLVLPLWQPGVSEAVRAARAAGYFLGGLLPLWNDRDMLLMQKLRSAPDYSRIQLFTQESRDLLDVIVADRESVLGSRSC